MLNPPGFAYALSLAVICPEGTKFPKGEAPDNLCYQCQPDKNYNAIVMRDNSITQITKPILDRFKDIEYLYLDVNQVFNY